VQKFNPKTPCPKCHKIDPKGHEIQALTDAEWG